MSRNIAKAIALRGLISTWTTMLLFCINAPAMISGQETSPLTMETIREFCRNRDADGSSISWHTVDSRLPNRNKTTELLAKSRGFSLPSGTVRLEQDHLLLLSKDGMFYEVSGDFPVVPSATGKCTSKLTMTFKASTNQSKILEAPLTIRKNSQGGIAIGRDLKLAASWSLAAIVAMASGDDKYLDDFELESAKPNSATLVKKQYLRDAATQLADSPRRIDRISLTVDHATKRLGLTSWSMETFNDGRTKGLNVASQPKYEPFPANGAERFDLVFPAETVIVDRRSPTIQFAIADANKDIRRLDNNTPPRTFDALRHLAGNASHLASVEVESPQNPGAGKYIWSTIGVLFAMGVFLAALIRFRSTS